MFIIFFSMFASCFDSFHYILFFQLIRGIFNILLLSLLLQMKDAVNVVGFYIEKMNYLTALSEE